MEKGHSFCEECNKIVQFDSRKKTLIGRIHGLDCEYYGTVALCPNCNSELYVAEYEDKNLEALKDSYRKNNNILTLNQSIYTFLLTQNKSHVNAFFGAPSDEA